MVDQDGSPIWGLSFNLPGKVQTVARGECFALLKALQLAPCGIKLEFVTDNKGVYDKFQSGRAAAILSNNGDFSKQIFEEISVKDIDLKVRWMPSHLEEDDDEVAIFGLSVADIRGNNHADKMAGEAAINFKVDLNASAAVLHNAALVRRIQKRLVAIIQSLVARKRDPKINAVVQVLPTKQDPEDLFQFSSHVLHNDGKCIKCARCRNSYNISHSYCNKWIISECPVIGGSEDRPRPLPLTFMNFGKRSICPTHKLNIYKGLVYCRTCGCYVISSLRLLASPCMPASTAGKQNLKMINQGKKPVKDFVWPTDLLDENTKSLTKATPIAPFVAQIHSDHPALSLKEAKVVADCMLRMADHIHGGLSDESAKDPPHNRKRLKMPRITHDSEGSNSLDPNRNKVILDPVSAPVCPNSSSLVANHNAEIQVNLANQNVVPYRFRPDCGYLRSETEAPIPKKQKIIFAGAPMDGQDAQWYDDASRTLGGVAASSSSVPDASPHVPCPVVTSSRMSRQLVRFDSEQAISLFLNTEHNAPGASSADDA